MADAKTLWDNGGMWTWAGTKANCGRAWNLYKNLKAGRDLLRALGFWKVFGPVISAVASTLLTVWASINGLPGPLVALVFLGTFLIILGITFVGVLLWKAVCMAAPDPQDEQMPKAEDEATQQPARDAPEVRLILTRFADRIAFAVENRSLVRDAENVTAELINGNGFELCLGPVAHLPRSSIPMELACKSFKKPTGEIIHAGIVRFGIEWTGVDNTQQGSPIAFDLKMLFKDSFASYYRIVHISSSWPSFGLAYTADSEINHESICIMPLGDPVLRRG